jgi:hypothetical protein
MIRLKDFVRHKINKRNSQESLDIQKLKLREFDLDIDDILEARIETKRKKRSEFL